MGIAGQLRGKGGDRSAAGPEESAWWVAELRGHAVTRCSASPRNRATAQPR